ncbi:MAG: N-acetylmuramoyl-L-alanine amidase [Anaerolineae bacterium]|nr:N-acetylmuramoyl-L-alanine amidase [Anaerolineae bacterium]
MSDNATINTNPPAPRPRSNPAGQPGIWRMMQTILSVSLLVATLLTFWTPANILSANLMDRMFRSFEVANAPDLPQATPTPSIRPRIGLVAGHWGNDSGAVCVDGLTEESVNLKIAELVRQQLNDAGFDVDLLQEFDKRLNGYQALALVSIHNDSCEYVNDQATGFKVAAAASTVFPEKATRLTACMIQRYRNATNMEYHANTITADMTEYHAFTEINGSTTAAIIETGFLNLDRDILVNHTDVVARGVAEGILCYVRNEDVPGFEQPTP